MLLAALVMGQWRNGCQIGGTVWGLLLLCQDGVVFDEPVI